MLRSDSIKNIAIALAKFQGEIRNPENTEVHPHFKCKYAPLSEVLNLVRPVLAKNGLSIFQSTETTESGLVGVKTMLLHESGEFIESDTLLLKPDKMTPQGAGACITYGRRYSISSILGISSEDDDDANSVSGNKPQQNNRHNNNQAKQQPKTNEEKPTYEKIDDKQRKTLFELAQKNQKLLMEVLNKFSYKNTKDISKADYNVLCSEVMKVASEEVNKNAL
jgi:hypothetical protein